MKDTMLDANFPRTADGRVYHLGIRAGELANRIVTVGDPSRALALASYLDPITSESGEGPLKIQSERGFLTCTGTYKGIPMSIVAIGMGFANMDFFVRECRECVSGEMAIIRLGSCGSILDSAGVGSLVIPRASVAITRNYDFDFNTPPTSESHKDAYRISKPAGADERLHEILGHAMAAARPSGSRSIILSNCVNASGDSFYSSQGRLTSFPDHNAGLIHHLLDTVEDIATLEMETFHLFHLASIHPAAPSSAHTATSVVPPPPTSAPAAVISTRKPSSPQAAGIVQPSRIHAAAAHMVFAARGSGGFITPSEVSAFQEWAGRGCLDALVGFELSV
ncbi:hypothetical protein BOTBODRAFT_29676 [Botryobasidium botryosum FD-172 SS1]|uniref:Nucleoside phosphorylase domain-containing protein n=1 Tax=Botryobasidium botryosum (strain FD-172 SS1) TaxID=930990 RepID=A0A067N015_BOTB1|nr:hypothetical protein BOTBODRAFT_29676 [Botryobasidium botryosum FD-172 SS1]